MLESIEASCIVADTRVRRVLGQIMPRVNLRANMIKAESLAQGAEIEPLLAEGSTTAMVQFSSGTTVDPKPVALSHAQILANADAIMDFFPERSTVPDSGVSWLPLYHDMGLIGCILPAVIRPGSLTLIPPEAFLARPSLWLRAISKYRATLSPAPDFAFGLCVDRIRDEELDGCDLSSWRLAMNGAESISTSRAHAFNKRFARWGLPPETLTPVYGLSEASLAVTFSSPERVFQSLSLDAEALSTGQIQISDEPEDRTVQLASVGRPLRGFKVEIRDTQGKLAAQNRVGHIWVKGPSLMQGYLGDLPSPIVDDWLHTGDMGFIYQDNLYIAGRAKDVIVLRGRNHNPVDIEQSLFGVEGIRTGCAAAVGAITSEGERLLVFVEVREPGEDTAELCMEAIRSSTGLSPDLLMLLEPGVLPRTSSGKIRRAETLRRWDQRALTPPNKVTPWLLSGAMARSAIGYLRAPTRRNG
jgi:acyl-CoA synthetase (AMP-forming)/AMP-acid ligase II